MREWIKDASGMIIGSKEKFGNLTRIFDKSGFPKGHHDQLSDNVFDAAGKLIGKGVEFLGSLLNK